MSLHTGERDRAGRTRIAALSGARRRGVLTWLAERPEASTRLICFPHAGGSAAIYRPWSSRLAASTEVLAVQPPGRGPLEADPPCDGVPGLVARVAPEVAVLADKPVALFGHSMGALLAFEVARCLRRVHGVTPLCLLASGFPAPHLHRPTTTIHELPSPRFWDEIRQLGGTPRAVLANDELRRVVEPALRADFGALERYAYADEPPLDCPIVAYRGRDDATVTHERLAAWREQTTAEFCIADLPGDHFSLLQDREVMPEVIAWELKRLLRSPNEVARRVVVA